MSDETLDRLPACEFAAVHGYHVDMLGNGIATCCGPEQDETTLAPMLAAARENRVLRDRIAAVEKQSAEDADALDINSDAHVKAQASLDRVAAVCDAQEQWCMDEFIDVPPWVSNIRAALSSPAGVQEIGS